MRLMFVEIDVASPLRILLARYVSQSTGIHQSIQYGQAKANGLHGIEVLTRTSPYLKDEILFCIRRL